MVDQWEAAQRLLGRGEGPATGLPGQGHQVREYKLILRGRFILGTDQTRWEPIEAGSAGEFHEDMSVLSFDRGAGQLVMRGSTSRGMRTNIGASRPRPTALNSSSRQTR
jgi:hypothetical protein